MPRARHEQISLEDTAYYHCINRCVRRAFLCGQDPLTERSYEHRRQWIVNKIQQLAQIFCIDICAYAIMSNHYHLILYVDQQRARSLSSREVLERWTQEYSCTQLIQRYLAGEPLSQAEQVLLERQANKWRSRLMDISWFMRCLNESIARKANKEDDCKGRFWEGRFKSQALLDEQALLSCMAYVDLNPIRAGTAETLETSSFTSIQARLKAYQQHKQNPVNPKQPQSLKKLDNRPNNAICHIPIQLEEYIELVDWTRQRLLANDTRLTAPNTPPLLSHLGITPKAYLAHLDKESSIHLLKYKALGKLKSLKNYAAHCQQTWIKGFKAMIQVYG